MTELTRCAWVTDDPIYQHYHDTVWGRPEYNSQQLFAKLCLDGQQAGLSWLTILKKQPNYEAAFHGFDPDLIVAMTDADVEKQLNNPGIVRNRLKIRSIIKNAQSYIDMRDNGEDFAEFLWNFVGGSPVQNAWKAHEQVPVTTEASDAMAKALKRRGFSFVGSTICYAFMQAVGMVNDHTTDCHCYETVRSLTDD